jgi:ABC-type multidrug transport system fused ATPase/permease subunit
MPKNKGKPYIMAVTYLGSLINPHKKWFITASLLAAVSAGTGLLNAKVTQLLIDSAVSGKPGDIINKAAMFAGIIILNLLITYISGISVAKLSALATRDMKRRITGALIHAEYEKAIELKAGDTLSTVNADTQNVTDFLSNDLIGLLSQALMLLGAISYLLHTSPLLMLVTFAYTPVGMILALKLNRRMQRQYPGRANKMGQTLSVIEQALMQLPLIKSFLMTKQLRHTVDDACAAVLDTEMKIAVSNALLQPACSSVAMVPRFVFMIFAGIMVMNGGLTLGAFIALLDLLGFVIGPTVYFPFMLNALNKAVASLGRVKGLEEIPRAANVMPEPKASGTSPSVFISQLSFGYRGDKPILSKLSFCHDGPGLIGLKGESGRGKTTLLDLLCGLLVPTEGEIRVAGKTAVMGQDSFLFDGTLLENVLLGKHEACNEEAVAALVRAGADNLNYDATAGNGGQDLSGGQRQRVALARTLLSDAAVWLLDEPTSALDSETEQIVLQTLAEEKARRLIIVAAHRPALLEMADRMIDLDNQNNLDTEGGDAL